MRDRTSRTKRFLSELRRRKVYRTGAAYAIGAFAIWQVIDIAGPALGWPEGVLTFFVVATIAMAPVVMALAWVFDIRREREATPVRESGPGRVEESTVATEPGGARRSPAAPRRRPAFAVIGPALIVSAGITWLLWPSESGGLASFEAGDSTLISQCENTTGDPNFDGLLNTALDASIRQSEHVGVFSHDRAQAFAVGYLSREAPVTIDAATASDIAVRLGLKVVIRCSIRRVGDAYVVAASITDPRERVDLDVLQETARGADGILGAIDRLAGRIREELGESLRAVQASAPLAMVSTPSLDALVTYTAGNRAWGRGDREAAHQLFIEALHRDSLFAAAHAALGNYYYWVGDVPRGADEYRKALRDPDRISDRDRLWIEAISASSRGEADRAINLLTTYVQRWPSDAAMWFNLGSAYFRQRDCDNAGLAFSRALALDPSDPSSHINLASCLALVGEADSALVHYERAFAMAPARKLESNLNHEYGQQLVLAGRGEEAEALFRGQLELSPDQQAAARRSLGLLRLRQGRYGEARTLLQDAARQRQVLNQGLSEYRDRLYLAGVLDVLNMRQAERNQVALIDRLMSRMYLSPAWLLRAFRRSLADGDIDASKAILARAEADTIATATADRAAIHAMRAHILAHDANFAGAMEEARLAVENDPGNLFAETVCRVALVADAQEAAIAACETLAQPTQIGLWEATEPGILANYWLGLLYERLGRPVDARERLARFLGFWGDADAGLVHRDWAYQPIDAISNARARLAGLTER
jgi:tetratricopeptide (TPR) repeat protein